MDGNAYVIMAVAIMAGVTFLIRALPFLILGDKKTPAYIDYLGKYLPYSIIGMLVVYCLKDISFTDTPYGLPELAAVILVAVLHRWKRNTLLSIVIGTVFYMLLLQLSK